MKKELFVVWVDNYRPDVASVTIPMLETYSKKIGARFTVIEKKIFHGYSPTYEKMQIFDLGKNNDVNILIDADMYITEDMYDVTEVIPKDRIGCWMEYDPSVTIKKDEYIKLDGTDRIPASNFIMTWQDHHDAWKPLDMSLETILSRLKRPFIVDEYCFGRNIKQYGYKTQGLSLPGAYENLFYHGNLTSGNDMHQLQKDGKLWVL